MSTRLASSDHDLLLAAHGPGPEATRAWQRWRDGIDWDGALPDDAFRLLPAVRRNLRSQGVDDDLFPRFLGIARQSWLRNQRRKAHALRWLATWPVDEVLVLPPTAALFHDGTRVLAGDALHLAIRPEAAARVVHHFLRSAVVAGPVRPPRLFVYGFVRGTGHVAAAVPDLGTVTTTWRLDHWLGERWTTAWRDAETVEAGPVALRTLAASDEVEVLLRHPVHGRPLGWAADLLSANLAEVDWGALGLSERPLDVETRGLLDQLGPLCPGWPPSPRTPGAGATFSTDARAADRQRPLTADPRWRSDWERYRQSWGSRFRW
ncbi:MAG: hypothetical protein ACKO2K_10080, partial [Alphaproteobacteria bacterium]